MKDNVAYRRDIEREMVGTMRRVKRDNQREKLFRWTISRHTVQPSARFYRANRAAESSREFIEKVRRQRRKSRGKRRGFVR